jgi:hypothetical protein
MPKVPLEYFGMWLHAPIYADVAVGTHALMKIRSTNPSDKEIAQTLAEWRKQLKAGPWTNPKGRK